MSYLLYTEELLLDRAIKAKRKRQGFLKIEPGLIEQLIMTIKAERDRSEMLVSCIQRNSHDNCFCKACEDARTTLSKAGLTIRLPKVEV